jgi:low affinity Fe/Cu permease
VRTARAACQAFARRAPDAVGSQWALISALVLVVGWIATGPLFRWSTNWVLWPATASSVGAFLLVLLLQYSQNRDTRSIQLKLDEVIRALAEARTELVQLERSSDEELEKIEEEFAELRKEQDAA